jgi:hypothetical protein
VADGEGSGGGPSKEPLTAKIAKKSRKGREEKQLQWVFFAIFAAFLGDLCG